MSDDRNWSGELGETLSHIMIWAPDFPFREWMEEPETLDTEFGELRELLDGLRTKVGHQEWMDRFLLEIERSYQIFREQGLCRAAVEPLQNAEEIMREAKQQKKANRSKTSRKHKDDENPT